MTTPGSALLFPSLRQPTGALALRKILVDDRCGDRTAMMPKRRRSRDQDRSQRMAAKRRQNQQAREARRQAYDAYCAELMTPTEGDGGPPPF